jgi:uncharacterized protein YlzI (FlbEa/FlbD family)
MITLHRLGTAGEPLSLNPDLIVAVEATPDTVITLANNVKLVVREHPEEVAAAIRQWRASVLRLALAKELFA